MAEQLAPQGRPQLSSEFVCNWNVRNGMAALHLNLRLSHLSIPIIPLVPNSGSLCNLAHSARLVTLALCSDGRRCALLTVILLVSALQQRGTLGRFS